MTKFKVLMADSNPQMLSMMKEYFTAQEGVSVFDTVTDGVSALEALHKTRYDVLITELIMPRADGFEIMERIAAGLVSDAPAVMVVSTMRQRGHGAPRVLTGRKVLHGQACRAGGDIQAHAGYGGRAAERVFAAAHALPAAQDAG